MRPIRALVIYLVFVFLGGALLAPWLYWLAQFEAHSFPKIAAAPFHRFSDRAFLILALVGIWPLLRALGAKSWREIGLVAPYGQSAKLFGGLLLGFFSLAILAGMAIGFGIRPFAHNLAAHKITDMIFSALATAAIVATLEEILFRGGIFGGLRRVLYWPFALLISSAIYALVHFLQRAEWTGAVKWDSGLILLPQMLAGFANFHALVPGFFNLTLAGILLGLAFQRTGNLYFSIGLHAGWIFWLKIYGAITTDAPRTVIWFWGTGKMIDGWLAFFVLVATLIVLKFLPIGEKRSPFTIPS
ncbi:MAG TPA: CPBP family intramembrane glutamic endopeptidase [Verrucomicrobiae bacterium]|nr:CPBP family intramembrane glutamic endopeptidase [Verrucomicrobiae bacterium]